MEKSLKRALAAWRALRLENVELDASTAATLVLAAAIEQHGSDLASSLEQDLRELREQIQRGIVDDVMLAEALYSVARAISSK